MSRRVPRVLVPILLSALAVGLVVPTYSHLGYTMDEPAHIATGLEWLDEGRYSYEEQHPPLARVAAALGPYLLGLRTLGHESMWNEGRTLLHNSAPGMQAVVTSARLGILPFLILMIVATWWLGVRYFDGATGAVAALLLALQPVVLGHAGLATTDVAGAAMLMVATIAGLRFAAAPTLANSAVLGAAGAGALLAKFSAVLMLPAIGAAMALALILRGDVVSRFRKARPSARLMFSQAGVCIAIAFLCIWAGYRFSIGPVVPASNAPFTSIDAVLDEGFLRDVAYRVVTMPVPAFEFPLGIMQVVEHNAYGHESYFLGEVSNFGWPAYFPVALLLKTPIPFLLLVAAGYAFAARRARTLNWQQIAVMAIPIALLASLLSAQLNIGLRHAVVVYPFLSIVAATGAVALTRFTPNRAIVGATFVALLIGWQAVGMLRSFPDYIAYFSEPFETEPHRYLVFSDLDWGQDLPRLGDTLSARGVEAVTAAFGQNLTRRRLLDLGVPVRNWLQPYTPVAGWIAIDRFSLALGSNSDARVPFDAYQWLLEHTPVARIGAATLLYHFDEAPRLSPAMQSRRDAWLALEIDPVDPDRMEFLSFRRRRPW